MSASSLSKRVHSQSTVIALTSLHVGGVKRVLGLTRTILLPLQCRKLDGPVITDPAMYSDDREARKRRAEYVHAAVDGRNVKSGEEMTFLTPGATTASRNYSTGWKPTARRLNGRTSRTPKPRSIRSRPNDT